MAAVSSLIHNRKRAKQLLAFDGLEWKGKKVTDIDMSMDWNGETFVFGEVKGMGQSVGFGQRFHYESLVRGLVDGGRKAVAYIAHHDTPNPSDDVFLHDLYISEYFDSKRGWVTPRQAITVYDFMDRLHRRWT